MTIEDSENNTTMRIRVALDSGNSLVYPAISTHVIDELKMMKIIPRNTELIKAKATIKGADGKAINIRGILNISLPIKIGNNQQLPLEKYYVVDALVNELNLGTYQMGRINCKWTFNTQEISIMGERKELIETNTDNRTDNFQVVAEDEKELSNLQRQLGEDKVHALYSKGNITLEAKTIRYIELITANNKQLAEKKTC